MDLRTDPKREDEVNRDLTGIYVRAVGQSGKWGSHDIAELDTDSLKTWLTSRGGSNPRAEDTVLILLGHQPK